MNNTSIEWTDYTWSPVTGCSPVSSGCANCYARRMAHRLRGRFGYPADDPFRVTLHPERLEEPLDLRKPRRIFTCSMGDLFHEAVPLEFIAQVFNIMACAALGATLECGKRHQHSEECWGGPPHTFLVLTKRPQRVRQVIQGLPDFMGENWPSHAALNVACEEGHWPLPNVWLGVSVENQAAADERIPILLQTPAAVRFVSVEPMLGPVALRPQDDFSDCGHGRRWLGASRNAEQSKGIDWVICGGETGPGARPMHPDWVRSLRDQCQAAGVPFLLKSWGDWVPQSQASEELYLGGYRSSGIKWPESPVELLTEDNSVYRVGKRTAGRLLDGRIWDEYPEGGDKDV